MSDPIKYKHIVAIGRIPEDDEDSVYMFTDLTEQEAREAFVVSIYDDLGDDEKTPELVEEQWGVPCYINCILASETPITGVAYNY